MLHHILLETFDMFFFWGGGEKWACFISDTRCFALYVLIVGQIIPLFHVLFCWQSIKSKNNLHSYQDTSLTNSICKWTVYCLGWCSDRSFQQLYLIVNKFRPTLPHCCPSSPVFEEMGNHPELSPLCILFALSTLISLSLLTCVHLPR